MESGFLQEEKERILRQILRRYKRCKKPVSVGELTHKYQQQTYDCGQACLEMLGYDGYVLFPDKPLREEDLMKIPGVERVCSCDIEDPFLFKVPYMIATESVQDHGRKHWIVAYKDMILCPSQGVKPNKKYRKFVWFDSFYKVPLNKEKQADSAR